MAMDGIGENPMLRRSLPKLLALSLLGGWVAACLPKASAPPLATGTEAVVLPPAQAPTLRPSATDAANPASSDAPRGLVGFVSQSAGTQSLFLIQPNGEIVLQLEQPQDRLLVAPDWDKDGRLVAYTNNQFAEDGRMNCTVEMIDLATLESRVVAGPYSYCGALSWSPSSDALVFEADVDFQEPNLDIYLIELASGEVSRLTTSSKNDSAPVWSHGGDKIAFSSASDTNDGSSNLSVLELSTGKISNDATITVAGPMAWGPRDGSIFLIGSAAPGVEIFEIDSLTAEGRALTHNTVVEFDLAVSEDNGMILAVGIEGNSYHLMTVAPDGQVLYDRVGGTKYAQPIWAPGGSFFAYVLGDGDGQICLGETGNNTAKCIFDGHRIDGLGWLESP
jgi:hypothetical protein